MESFINVPVPVEHVTKVYALLGKLADAGSDDSNVDASGDRQLTSGGWTEEDLERLSRSPQASVQRIANMLDLLSESPGQPIAYTDIVKSLHLTRGELQGALSGFSRWIRKNWGDDDGWPMDVAYRDAQAEGQASESYYLVTDTTANRWLGVRRRGYPEHTVKQSAARRPNHLTRRHDRSRLSS